MDWVEGFYTRKSEWHGPSGILPHHEERAATINRLCGAEPKRVLELGAGAGGSAAATANLGHSVVAIELSPLRAAYAQDLANEPRAGALTVIHGDFYTVELDHPFDVVTYWNGFGVGTDADQRRLLKHIRTWLTRGGVALVDVFSPWRWTREAGQTDRDEETGAMQQIDFDPIASRFLDRWWKEGDAAHAITQSIRCYPPADLVLLLEDTGLTLDLAEVDGIMFDVTHGEHTMHHPLWEAWSYLTKLIPNVSTQEIHGYQQAALARG
jgi:SAM-dependent methyltransferase